MKESCQSHSKMKIYYTSCLVSYLFIYFSFKFNTIPKNVSEPASLFWETGHSWMFDVSSVSQNSLILNVLGCFMMSQMPEAPRHLLSFSFNLSSDISLSDASFSTVLYSSWTRVCNSFRHFLWCFTSDKTDGNLDWQMFNFILQKQDNKQE